jgi:hypothetical protein
LGKLLLHSSIGSSSKTLEIHRTATSTLKTGI